MVEPWGSVGSGLLGGVGGVSRRAHAAISFVRYLIQDECASFFFYYYWSLRCSSVSIRFWGWVCGCLWASSNSGNMRDRTGPVRVGNFQGMWGFPRLQGFSSRPGQKPLVSL